MHLKSYIHQKSYEKIEKLIRKDLITTIPAILLFLFLLAIPPLLLWLFKTQLTSFFVPGPTFSMLLTLATSLYYLSVGIFFYTYFINYYLDLLIITNDRLMHIDQEGVFSRTISEVDLYKIQDITSTVDGFFPSIFNYGNLHIQTAGAVEKFAITHIPQPEHLRHRILELAEEDRKYHSQTGNISAATS